ncbi:MAG: ABC transporter permease [Acidobacteriaceae bacterium]|nr:ABC transporter permease [Acidobacteriaceae bacterium]
MRRRFRQAWYVVANVFTLKQKDRELDDEIRAYTDLLSYEKTSRGMSQQEAKRRTRMEIGGMEQIKEEIRSRRTGAPLANLLQDVRYASRMLRQKPAFTAVAVATLAIGIGANTAIFSVVDATLLTPIPVPSPARIALVWTEDKAHGYNNFPASVPDYLDWKASGIFQSLAAFTDDGFNLRIGDHTERLDGIHATAEWFSILGAKPILGRTFTSSESQPGHNRVVVLGWNYWNSHFQANRAVIGSTVVIDGAPHTVVGVLPKTAARFEHEEIYVPAAFDRPDDQSRGSRSWIVVGRIAPGLSLQAAQQRINALNQRILKQHPDEERGVTLRLQPIEEAYVEDVKPLLLVVCSAVGFVLLIACANIANLLLARGTARRKEMAIRVAVGASRGRILAQLLSESVLLALIGAAVGIAPAYAGIRLIPKLGGDLPNANLIDLNPAVLLFAFGLALVAAIMFGFLPALQFRKAENNQPLRESERGLTSQRQNRLGSLFVIAEIAFTMVLLAGAGLMVRSLLQLRSHNPGYDAPGALTMQTALTSPQLHDAKKQTAFVDSALDQLGHIPGIEAAAATDAIPAGDSIHGSGLHFTDRPEPRPGDVPIVLTASVSSDYFRTLAIPVERGRVFRASDSANAPLVVLIDTIAAKKHWPNQDPVGKMIKLERTGPARTIVGVVGAVEQAPLVKALMGERGQVYIPLAQAPKESLFLVVRTHSSPATIIPVIRRTVANLDPDVPLYKVQTLDELRAEARAPTRMGTILLMLFGVIALLLAAIGVFGVVSYTVGQRIREFGIRIALGATTSDVLKLTLGRGAFLVGSGTLLGLLGAAALARVVDNLLSGVNPNDPLTFAAATLILVSIGLLASYLPARRASRVDATIVLRSE